MLLVTGATGGIGRLLVERLAADGAKVRAVTRNPAAADLPAGVEVVQGDPSRPATLDAGFAGVTALFLHPRTFGDSAAGLLALARRHGVNRVVALSAMNIDEDPAAQPSRYRGDRNREAERDAVASGLAWVSLRVSSFAGNLAQAWGAQLRAGDVVRYVHPSFEESFLDERDLVEVAARALRTDELDGRRLAVTGPESLSHGEALARIGAVLGRSLRFEEVAPAVAARGMLAGGLPEPFVTALLARYAAHLDRPQHPPTTDVAEVLGRPARGIADWAADHAAEFTR